MKNILIVLFLYCSYVIRKTPVLANFLRFKKCSVLLVKPHNLLLLVLSVHKF